MRVIRPGDFIGPVWSLQATRCKQTRVCPRQFALLYLKLDCTRLTAHSLPGPQKLRASSMLTYVESLLHEFRILCLANRVFCTTFCSIWHPAHPNYFPKTGHLVSCAEYRCCWVMLHKFFPVSLFIIEQFLLITSCSVL